MKQNVVYIVCGILLRTNSSGKLEILMVQEARNDCYGLWYLPAGRLEPGESLENGLKREVMEEAGLSCQPISLISCEIASAYWYRFTFYAKATSGELKSVPDEESLQASWLLLEDVMNGRVELRATDVLSLLPDAINYREKLLNNGDSVPKILSTPTGFHQLVIRLLLFDKNFQRIVVCSESKNFQCLPSVLFSPKVAHCRLCLQHLYRCIIEDSVPSSSADSLAIFKLHGLVDFLADFQPNSPTDGICLVLLASTDSIQPVLKPKYQWLSVDCLPDVSKKVPDFQKFSVNLTFL